MADETMLQYAKQIAACDQKLDSLEAEKKALNKMRDEAEDALLRSMRAQEVESFRTAEGMFFIRAMERPRIIEQDRAFTFLREIGMGSIIKETVNSNTLLSSYRELQEAGKIDAIIAKSHGIEVYTKEQVIRKN